MKAVCLSCLEARGDIDSAWLEASSVGEPVERVEGPSGTEFPGIVLVAPNGTPCPHCQREEVLIAVKDDVAVAVERLRQTSLGSA